MRTALLLAFLLPACTSEVWDPMEHQPKATPYAPSHLFSDGRTMRPTPSGTVAREEPREEIAVAVGDAGFFATPEPPLSQGGLERGQHIFEIYCAACHGLRGNGVSEVARKMSLRPPPSMLIPPASELTDIQLFGVITSGYGLMPPLREWLSPDERWAVVSYVRALQLSANAQASELAPEDLRHLSEPHP